MKNDENFGETIKKLAIVYIVVVGIFFLAIGIEYMDLSARLGITYIAIGIMVAVYGGLLIYGFGVVIENTSKTTEKINELIKIKKVERQQKSVFEEDFDNNEIFENNFPEPNKKIKCPICLKDVDKNSHFCKHCGHKLKD